MKYTFIKNMLQNEYVKRGVRVDAIQDILNSHVLIPENIRQAYCEEVEFLKGEMSALVNVNSDIEFHLEKV